jgi:hypothetical protein
VARLGGTAGTKRSQPLRAFVAAAAVVTATGLVARPAPASAEIGRVPGGGVLRVSVPEAFGGKTVIGQLTVDQVVGAGFVTAYGCDDGLPTDASGAVTRSDLNYDSAISPIASNRLIVEADDEGDVCFYTLRPAALIVDVNAVSFDTGVSSFANRRTDTRQHADPLTAAGGVVRIAVPEAVGGKTVVGQLTVDRAQGAGFVTAYGCADGLPRDSAGDVTRSDLNFDSAASPIASNRLIVAADDNGDVCFYTQRPAALIVDINGVADTGIRSFANTRTDTRMNGTPIAAGEVLRVPVTQALTGKTVIGQLTVDEVSGPGFVTAYGCADGMPTDADGEAARSDLNYDGRVSPVASNRLIVEADDNGDVCFYTLGRAALIVDINGVSDTGIMSFPNQRTDTRASGAPPPSGPQTEDGVPVWPPYTPLPALDGVAALTGRPADGTIAQRPVLAVKIDNFGAARPQWGLDQADAVLEVNVEGVSRFIALFHSSLPTELGPVRSARTGDLDLLTAMNRPVFAFSGANPGVTQWIASAAGAGVLVDFSALQSPCYSRSPDRAGPHNLLLDPACALAASPTAGAARPLWTIDPAWTPSSAMEPGADTTFTVPMDGVRIEWTWDAASGTYLRAQDGVPHVAVSGARIAAANVVELATSYIASPVDARSPNAITVGSGVAVVHRDGIAIPATWSRATAYDRFEFRDVVTNHPIALDAGSTFLEFERG